MKKLVKNKWYSFHPYHDLPEVKWFLKYKDKGENGDVKAFYYLGEFDSNNYIYVHEGGTFELYDYKLVTQKEKTWLNECVELNKVIDFNIFLIDPLLKEVYNLLNLDY